MKVFVAIVALLALAAANPLARNSIVSDAEIATIVAAIQSPSTDPATAAVLESQLQAILAGANPITIGNPIIDAIVPAPAIVDEFEPIAVGPAIIDQVSPIAVGPAIVEFPVDEPSPIAVGPVIVDSPVVPSPVVIHPNPESVPEYSTPPLVQIILNINQGESSAPVVIPPAVVDTPIETPVAVDPVIIAPEPVAAVEPVLVAVPIMPEVIPEPVVVGTPELPEPVVIPDPVVIGTPELPVVIPEAAITLPEILN